MRTITLILFSLVLLLGNGTATSATNDYFKITVVDEQTGRGVPLVELTTTSNVRYYTDSNGIIAFDEPGLMEQEVFFHIKSHGYEFPTDGFGNRGQKLKPTKGGSARIKIKRLNIAERLYRITGEGIYRDSILVGHPVPIKHPLLNGQVMGQDTVIATPYRGKIFWFWGDTDRPAYPLGNFGASGATSELPGHGGLDPSVGVDLTYFVDASGFSKPMCPNFGPGLQWIESVMAMSDDSGKERLVARVSSQKGLLPAYAWNLAVFNDEKESFESKVKWDLTEAHDSSHPFHARVEGAEYLYLYPNFRVKADLKSLSELKHYEAFTCVAGDGKVVGAATQIERDAAGRALYSWKKGADRLHPGRLQELISSGKLNRDEAWLQLRDVATDTPVEAGRGSVCWNEFRQRWVMLVSGRAGEIWFAEADTPAGPWVYARRVVSHDNYNFYNPTQHSFFDQESARLIYFEGTYTASFSGAKEKTPRYDYNQIMYRLTIDDPKLNLPVAVYRVKGAGGSPWYLTRERIEREQAWPQIEEAAFFALPPNRGRGGMIPIFAHPESGQMILREQPAAGNTEPLFFALPVIAPSPAPTIAGTWQCELRTSDGGQFSVSMELSVAGEKVSGKAGDGIVLRQGTFKNGKLNLELLRENEAYTFVAAFKEGKLAGDWKRGDGNLSGTWTATRSDSTRNEDQSPAISPLYEYRRADGQRLYSTMPDLANKNLQRSAEPLCRVWKNPMAVLILDPGAKPVPLVKN